MQKGHRQEGRGGRGEDRISKQRWLELEQVLSVPEGWVSGERKLSKNVQKEDQDANTRAGVCMYWFIVCMCVCVCVCVNVCGVSGVCPLGVPHIPKADICL